MVDVTDARDVTMETDDDGEGLALRRLYTQSSL